MQLRVPLYQRSILVPPLSDGSAPPRRKVAVYGWWLLGLMLCWSGRLWAQQYVYQRQFGNGGSGDGQFQSPTGLAVDGRGLVYVADTENQRIQQFDSSGHFLLQFGSEGSGQGQFSFPADLAVDGLGHLYVVDAGNHRIQQFFPSGSYVPYAFQVGEYTLTATPYSHENGQGKPGLGQTVQFQVVNSTARTSVGEGVASLEVAVYPNPFAEQVLLLIRSSASQTVEVQAYDAKGRRVGRGYEAQLQAGQQHRVEISGRSWAAGLYLLRVTTPRGQLVKKVMRQR